MGDFPLEKYTVSGRKLIISSLAAKALVVQRKELVGLRSELQRLRPPNLPCLGSERKRPWTTHAV